jgi:hypothetical protein
MVHPTMPPGFSDKTLSTQLTPEVILTNSYDQSL